MLPIYISIMSNREKRLSFSCPPYSLPPFLPSLFFNHLPLLFLQFCNSSPWKFCWGWWFPPDFSWYTLFLKYYTVLTDQPNILGRFVLRMHETYFNLRTSNKVFYSFYSLLSPSFSFFLSHSFSLFAVSLPSSYPVFFNPLKISLLSNFITTKRCLKVFDSYYSYFV